MAFITLVATTFAPSLASTDTKLVPVFPPPPFSFSGAWACQGKFRNGVLHKARFEGSTTAGGSWIQLEEKDLEPATGYVATYLIGYDTDKHLIVEFDASNSGAAFYSSMKGWQGGSIILTSEAVINPQVSYDHNRFIYSVTGTDDFSVDWQVRKPANEEWLEGDHLSCHRDGR